VPLTRLLMISLVLISGTTATGCTRSPVVPPTTSIPHTPLGGPPSITRMWPRTRHPSPPRVEPATPLQPQQRPSNANPWQPEVAARSWNSIVIHHTAASFGDVESIHEAHLARKDANGNAWLGIGYHFVIGNGRGMSDGEIETTFRWRQQLHGAHAGDREHNQSGIGIALVGNFDEGPPTPAQVDSVKRLVATLKAAYSINSESVLGHGEIKATACPGKYFPMGEVSLDFSRTYSSRPRQAPSESLLAGLRGSRKR